MREVPLINKKKVKKRDAKKSLQTLFLFLLLFFIFWALLARMKLNFQSSRIQLITVQEGLLEVKREGNAFVFADEKVLTAPARGMFRPLAAEGERVSVGEALAELVDGAQLTSMIARLDELQKEIVLFVEKSEQKEAELEMVLKERVEKLSEKVNELKDALSAGEPEQSYSIADEISSLLQERHSLLTELATERRLSQDTMEMWHAKEKNLRDSLQAAGTSIRAPVAGIVSYCLDGNENYFSQLSTPKAEVQTLLALAEKPINIMKSGQLVSAGQPILRLVDNFSCILAVYISPDALEEVEGSSRLTVRFSELNNRELSCPVLSVEQVGESALLLLKIPEYWPELLQQRLLSLAVITKSYRGLVIPREAILEKGLEKGVYTVRGKKIIYQPIEVIGGNDEAVVVKGLSLYQEIIANPAWVREGQSVR